MVKDKNLILRKVVTRKPKYLGLETDFPQRITLNFKVLPEAKTWMNGKKYQLILQVEQHSSTKDNATFEIEKVAPGAVVKDQSKSTAEIKAEKQIGE